jgi:hypothetical protein
MGLLDAFADRVGQLALVVGAHARQRQRSQCDVEDRLAAVPLVPFVAGLIDRDLAEQPHSGGPSHQLAPDHPAERGHHVRGPGVDALPRQDEDAVVVTEGLGQQGAVLLPAGEHDRLAVGQPVGQERHHRGRQVLGRAVEERGVQAGWSGGGGHR